MNALGDNPVAYCIRRQEWQFFGTLTFHGGALKYARRLTPWFNYARMVARHKGVHFKTLLWVLRLETGELHERPHYHFLLAGLPRQEVSDASAGFLGGIWSNSLKYGIVDVRKWDGRDAVSYITDGCDWNAGANRYESAKFGGATHVEFGESFLTKWQQSLGPQTRS